MAKVPSSSFKIPWMSSPRRQAALQSARTGGWDKADYSHPFQLKGYPGKTGGGKTGGGKTGGGKTGGGNTGVQYTHPAPTAPFLTAPQQAGLIKYDTGYGYNVAALNRKLGDDTATTNQNLANSQRTHDLGYNNANQNTAARGLFQSSIRGTDLNDLDTAMTMRNNILNTNLARMNIDTQSQLARMGTDYATTHNLYNTMAIQNAQGIPPTVPTVIPPAKPAAPPAPKAPSAPKQPAAPAGPGGPVGPGGPSGMNEGLFGRQAFGNALEQNNDNLAAGKGLG